MIAVSSHKPGSQLHAQARQTWDGLFDYVVYFGSPDPALTLPKTAFIPAEDFPRIQDLARFCSQQPGWSAIINADIHLHSGFAKIAKYLEDSDHTSATAVRLQFEREFGWPTHGARCEDLGLDIFAATQEVWCDVEHYIPERFRIGHILWDTWMIGFLIARHRTGIFNFSPWELVYHPRHPSRHQEGEDQYTDAYIQSARWPPKL